MRSGIRGVSSGDGARVVGGAARVVRELVVHLHQSIRGLLVDVRDGKPLMENPERMKKWFGVFEEQLKKEKGFLVGGTLSYADYATFWIMPKRLAILSEEEKAGFPFVNAWLERMKTSKGVTVATEKGWPKGF